MARNMNENGCRSAVPSAMTIIRMTSARAIPNVNAWGPSLGSWFGPQQDAGHGECGLVVHGEFVGAHGQAAPLFESRVPLRGALPG
jgi:hypothetical protein